MQQEMDLRASRAKLFKGLALWIGQREEDIAIGLCEPREPPEQMVFYDEYIIKKGVVKRKMSGGSMSAERARAYACIQSIAMTCQLRGISFHRFLNPSLSRATRIFRKSHLFFTFVRVTDSHNQ
jgi:hypothetical protein